MIRYLSAIILILLWVTPGFSGYAEMKQAQKSYDPPRGYSPEFNGFPQRVARDAASGDSVATQMAMVRKLETEIPARQDQASVMGDFTDYEPYLVKRMSGLNNDPRQLALAVGEGFSMTELEILVLMRNPDIKAAVSAVASESESFNQVASLDDLLKSYSAFTDSLDNRVGPLKTGNPIAANHPSPGVTALKGRIVQESVAVADRKMAVVVRDRITDLRKAFWDYDYVNKALAITRDIIQAMERLHEVATTLYASGKTSYQDSIKIRIRTSLLAENLTTLSREADLIRTRILGLIDLPLTTKLGKPESLDPGKDVGKPDTLRQLARSHVQELDQLRHAATRMENMVELAETMSLPGFSLNLALNTKGQIQSTGTQAGSSAFPEKTMAGMKNGLPIKPWFGLDISWLAQSRLLLEGLRQTLAGKERAVDTQVEAAWFAMDRSARELNLYRDQVIPLSGSALDAANRGYESGALVFSEAFDAYNGWLGARIAEAGLERSLGQAIAELERTIGKTLPDNPTTYRKIQ
ncbi:MAG: TolC family protein [Pseudomonadota bacterium]